MDLSNSTGQSTNYRVSGTGGVTKEGDWTNGLLKPGERQSCPPYDGRFRLQFFIADEEVASATFFRDPEVLVILKEDEWGYRIQPDKLA